MQSAEQYVQAQLESLFDLDCERVREGAEKSADLTASSKSGERFIVEVKTLHPRSPRGPDRDGFFVYEDPWFERSSAGTAVKKAAKQIRQTSASHYEDSVGLLWLMSVDDDEAEFRLDQALGELLGLRGVVCSWPDQESAVHIRCIGAKPSRFERHPEIAGAIVAYPDPPGGVQLFVNPYSPKAQALRKTDVARKFASYRAVVDPAIITEASQGYLVCETTVDRRNDREIIEYLKERFRLNDAHMCDFKRYSSAVLVRR
tara:strand:+ start:475 stop:1251 length:777 start_codon:yes stop_codon:yes gene_type:complete